MSKELIKTVTASAPSFFEGSISTILEFPDDWREKKGIILDTEYLVENGLIKLEFDQEAKLTATFIPLNNALFVLQAPKIEFHTDLFEIMLIITWKDDIATIFINRQEAASNRADFKPPTSITVSTKAHPPQVDHTTYKNQNENKKTQRFEETRNLTPKKDTRLRTLKERIDFLKIEIEMIQDLIKEIEIGKPYYWMPLATSIRKLVCRLEQRQHVPLLQRIASLLDAPLNVYSNPSEIPFAIESMTHGYEVFISTKPDRCFTLVDLDCWLDFKHAGIRKKDGTIIRFTNNMLLRELANTLACHIDDSAYELSDFMSLSLIKEGKHVRSIYTQNLIQTSEVIIELSNQLIELYEKK